MRSAIDELARPMRGRSSKTSTAPSTSPRTPATPAVGCSRAAAIWSSVVLPAPLAPSTTQRSPSSTSHVTSSRSVEAPRRTVTPAKARTSLMARPYDKARLDVWRDLGERALFVALPRPGDLSRMPRGSSAATAHAADAGECVFVAGIGGVLVPTLSEYGPEGDVGLRADWTAYEADPLPRHRMEMLDLREIERELMSRMREHTAGFEQVGGHPWGDQARAEAQADLDTALWGIPTATSGRALRIMSLAANLSRLAHRTSSLTSLGSGGLDAGRTVPAAA